GVGGVRAGPDGDGAVAAADERLQVAGKRARLIARAGVPARVEPGLDDRIAADLRLVGGVPAVLGVVAEERADLRRVVRLPGMQVGGNPGRDGAMGNVVRHQAGSSEASSVEMAASSRWSTRSRPSATRESNSGGVAVRP